MNIFQIECFLALAKSLNFTQTSEEMYITQPTLSRNIASLEQEIGAQLLIRNTKSVELTPAGEAFAQRAAKIVEQYHRGIEDARQAKSGTIGLIKLGVQQDSFEISAVRLVTAFRRKHPEIQLQIRTMSNSRLVQKLNAGELDVIVSGGDVNLDNPGKLVLVERQECAVFPVDHPFAERESVTMKELKDENFVAMSPSFSTSGHYLLLKYAAEAGFKPNIVSVVESIPAVLMQVACGTGIAVLYKELSITSRGMLKFVPIEGLPTYKRRLLWDNDSKNPALHAFVECAQVLLGKTE